MHMYMYIAQCSAILVVQQCLQLTIGQQKNIAMQHYEAVGYLVVVGLLYQTRLRPIDCW